MVVLLILFCWIAISGVCLAGSEDSNVLKITTHELAYANLYKPINIPLDAENITLEYYAKVDGGMVSYSAGPAVHFWWDSSNGIAIKVNLVYPDGVPGYLRFFNPINQHMKYIGYTDAEDLPVLIHGGVWYGYKIQMDSEKVRFYVREIGGDWIELELAQTDRNVSIFFPPDGLVVGTGGPQASDFGPNPHFRNSIADKERLKKSKVRSVYFDNIVLTVDGKVVFTETFERSIDELKSDWDFATDPINKEPVFEIVSEADIKM